MTPVPASRRRSSTSSRASPGLACGSYVMRQPRHCCAETHLSAYNQRVNVSYPCIEHGCQGHVSVLHVDHRSVPARDCPTHTASLVYEGGAQHPGRTGTGSQLLKDRKPGGGSGRASHIPGGGDANLAVAPPGQKVDSIRHARGAGARPIRRSATTPANWCRRCGLLGLLGRNALTLLHRLDIALLKVAVVEVGSSASL